MASKPQASTPLGDRLWSAIPEGRAGIALGLAGIVVGVLLVVLAIAWHLGGPRQAEWLEQGVAVPSGAASGEGNGA